MCEYLIGHNCKDGYKVVIEGGEYQAAVSTGEYSLVGCTVAPGFDFTDFSFMTDQLDVITAFKPEFPEYHYLI